MIGYVYGDDEIEKQGSSRKNRLIKMAIMEDKMGMVSFLQKLETWETMLEIGSFLHKLEREEKPCLK